MRFFIGSLASLGSRTYEATSIDGGTRDQLAPSIFEVPGRGFHHDGTELDNTGTYQVHRITVRPVSVVNPYITVAMNAFTCDPG